jgi:two-component system, OmpR family, response regulator MprA
LIAGPWSCSEVSLAITNALLASPETFLKPQVVVVKVIPSFRVYIAGMNAAAVIVIEDDSSLARSLERSLASVGQRVARQYMVELERQGAAETDILILSAPDGIDAVRRLRPCSSTPIVVIGSRPGLEQRVATLDAGADDVLCQPFALDELVARVRALQRGRTLAMAQAVEAERRGCLGYADVLVDQDARTVTRAGRPLALRHKAFELLIHFVRYPERVHSRPDLLHDVWGFEHLGESNVIDVTVSQLRRALECEGEPRLIHTVRPLGYILRSARAAISDSI